MASTATIRRRLESAETLQSVVTTMKTLSAVRITQYKRAVEALAASNATLELAAQALLLLEPELLEVVAREQNDGVAIIVLGSDRGLCGPFNERIARHAVGLLAARSPRTPPQVLAVGRRLEGRLSAAGRPPTASVRPPGHVAGIDAAVVETLAHIDRWTAADQAGRLYLAYNRPTHGALYEPTALRVVPVDAPWLARLRARPWPSRRLPLALGDTHELLRGLVRQFIAHAVVQAFASSLASENAARLAAMDAAERNIEERLERLRTAHRQARQNAVTSELLDIQAAFASLQER